MINHDTNFVIEKIFKIFMKTLMMTISEAEENVKYMRAPLMSSVCHARITFLIIPLRYIKVSMQLEFADDVKSD